MLISQRIKPVQGWLIGVLIGIVAALDPALTYAATLPAAYRQVSGRLALPASLVYLAALSRSGVRLNDGCIHPWPWTLTVNHQTTFYGSRAEAHTALLQARAQGITAIQVGLMQLHDQRVGVSAQELLEPAYNLDAGMRLIQQRSRHRASWGSALNTLQRRYQRTGLAGQCQAHPPRVRTKQLLRSQPLTVQLVHQIAPRYGVDPALVMAVIAQESSFNPSAVSAKQAQGLMQLIPETARRFGVRNPFDPKQNIQGGIAYLHFLLRHFQGDVALTLAGYNAGEQAVDKYQRIPPYRETQHYVRRIMAQYPKPFHPVPPALRS